MIKKYLIGFCLTASLLFAVEVPVQKINTVEIAIGEFAVFEFPFEIKGATPTSFRGEYSIEKIKKDAQKVTGGDDYLDAKLPPKKKTTATKQGKKTNQNQKTKAVNVKRTSRTISVLPKKYGDMSFLIYGHSELSPINLKIKVVKNKKGATSIKFTDYSRKTKTVRNLEKTSHEKIITVLITHLYNKITPKGYVSATKRKNYKIGKVKMKLVRSIVGNDYRADEWIIKNGYSETKRFHEEMFYNNGIYAVSLENNVLSPGEATRLFVVRNNQN